MVNFRMVPGIWDRTSLTLYRLSSTATIVQKSTHVRNFDLTRTKGLRRSNESCNLRSPVAHGMTGYDVRRGFATTDPWLAKSKNRGKDNKKPTKVQVNLAELSEVINVDKLTAAMEGAVAELKNNYTKNLTLRSSVGSIEQIPVTWEGREYRLQELSQIARKPKTLVINASAFPQVVPSILEAITKSGMNLNPQQDGTTLFVPIPKVTKEHRENLAKSAKAMFVGCRDAIRETQLRGVKSMKSKTDLSQDVIHRTQDQLRTLADRFVDEAEAVFKTKLKELLGDSD